VIDTLENPKDAQRRVEEGRAHVEKSFNAIELAGCFYDMVLQVSESRRERDIAETDAISNSLASSSAYAGNHGLGRGGLRNPGRES
jgi:hypothetical protein